MRSERPGARSADSAGEAPPRTGRDVPPRTVALSVVLAVLGTIGLASALVVPVEHQSFSGAVIRYGCGGAEACSTPAVAPSTLLVPRGGVVEFGWSSESGFVSFLIYLPGGGSDFLCGGQAVTGNCTFSSLIGGAYYLHVYPVAQNFTMAQVDYSGDFVSPVL